MTYTTYLSSVPVFFTGDKIPAYQEFSIIQRIKEDFGETAREGIWGMAWMVRHGMEVFEMEVTGLWLGAGMEAWMDCAGVSRPFL